MKLFLCTMMTLAAWAAEPRTDALVLSTLHHEHAARTGYSFRDLVRILETFDPDLVCVEVRPKDFRRVNYLPEMTLATVWALERGKAVRPIDWWLDAPNDRQLMAEMEKTAEFKQKAAEEQRRVAENPVLSGFLKKYPGFYSDPKLGYAFWNGKDYDAFSVEAFRLSMEIWGDSPVNLHYQSRNRHMVDLALAAMRERTVKRVVVLAGSQHKHYFDRALRGETGVAVVDFESLLPLKDVQLSGAVRELIEAGNDRPYFEPGYAKDVKK